MDNDDRPWAEKVRRGMGPAMQTNANAELAMRVKALEADVERLQRDVRAFQAAVAADVAALQRRVMSQETLRALVDEVKAMRRA